MSAAITAEKLIDVLVYVLLSPDDLDPEVDILTEENIAALRTHLELGIEKFFEDHPTAAPDA